MDFEKINYKYLCIAIFLLLYLYHFYFFVVEKLMSLGLDYVIINIAMRIIFFSIYVFLLDDFLKNYFTPKNGGLITPNSNQLMNLFKSSIMQM